ncbi:tetraspanin-2A-like [Musca domestica]|uniref:Tetraspanin-2A n=1 Tax=Musca domestica TaxID=7370 RepID=A0A1I8M3Q5_MUSDO|nr:tetraspanin-2A [Musca domestica]XP_005179691.1 tetraspanin-2A [Musca domestica]XP_058982280.1 tetraspanin-2A-like [Musca domestica]XP_058982281.1 tetraspanin-2A-like [Musca domestica]XP_058982285.1 tetraspanin-2A-like [Musca domestica]XP_058982290.1 tetraspanin-2A-like [Musca domestica]
MKMSFSIPVWKYALLTLSIVISMLCVVLISVGVITLGGAGSPLGAYTASLLGCLVFSLCTVGSFAALRESHLLSMVFAGLGVFTIVCETIFMIAFAVMKEDFMEMTKQRVEDTWQQELVKPGAMLDVQIQYECCGLNGQQDYLEKGDKLPSSCCYLGDCSDSDNIFPKGCEVMSIKFIDSQSDNLILSLVGLVAFEALGIISAYYLAKAVQARGVKSEQAVLE